MKKALLEFTKLKLEISTPAEGLPPSVAAEPLWTNPRFKIKGIDKYSIHHHWRRTLDSYRITDLIGDDGATYTLDEWSSFYCNMRAPDAEGNPPSEAACARRKVEASNLLKSVPPALIKAAAKNYAIKKGDIVSMIHDSTQKLTYARARKQSQAMVFEELWLDASGRAHLTGRLTSMCNRHIEKAALWGEHTNIGASRNALRVSGPMRDTFPNDKNWAIPMGASKTKPIALHELTINFLTRYLIDKVTAPPHASAKWNRKLQINLDWSKLVWPSIGTTFTNMTHEKAWYTLAHRGLNVKNHHSKLSTADRRCRMCRSAPESMEHIITCREARPLWLQIIALLQDMGVKDLGDTTPKAILTTVVTNLDNYLKKTSDSARATIRIAFRQHYAGIVRTETEDTKYDWKQTYLSTLQSLRTVATARGERTALRITHAQYTTRSCNIPKGEAANTAPILLLDEENPGEYDVNPIIISETERIKAAIRAKRQKHHPPGRCLRPPPPPHNG